MNWVYEPWPWYVSGPLIALVMFALLFLGKQFGVTSNLRTLCTIGGAGRVADFFKIDWRKERWNLVFILGAAIGGFLGYNYLSDKVVAINPSVATQLSGEYHIDSGGKAYLPPEIYDASQLSDPYMLVLLLAAGFLVGFGARYAGGCTSGHAISGLSNLQLPSLIAVAGFFIGGLVMIHLLFPFIF